MRLLGWAGLIVLLLGIASLFVSIPKKETHGIKAGDVNIGVQTQHSEPVPRAVSVALIAVGGAMMFAGKGSRR